MREVFAIRNAEQLALATRLAGHLRLGEIQLWLPQAMARDMQALKRTVSAERARTDAGLQSRAWRMRLQGGLGDCCCTVQSQFFDSGADRLLVRNKVYSRATELCRGGRPPIERISAAIRADIAPGHLARNPHCVSDALRAHSGVCQAIAVYAQQLLLRCGYPAIIRTGMAGGVPHGWNEVKVDGRWHLYDMSVLSPIDYHCDQAAPAEQIYRDMTRGLARTVQLKRTATIVNGLALPFLLGREEHVYPTRLVQAFNGAYQRTQQGLVCCLGQQVRQIPFSALTETPDHIPVMRTEAFASMFSMQYNNGSLRFAEGL